MNKAFTRESDYDPASDIVARPRDLLPPGVPNYITAAGAGRLRSELQELQQISRPALTNRLSALAAAGRGDDPEHGAAKRQLLEVDAQLSWLAQRIENLEVVAAGGVDEASVRFGARVAVRDDRGQERAYRIVGIDEADPAAGAISWISPIARALLGREEGDEVIVELPRGRTRLQLLAVRYDPE